MVLEGFARTQFMMISRDANEYRDKKREETKHNLDFIFERDGKAYGIEVKNTLGYMERDEFLLKTRLCLNLGIRPVFVCRMLPKSWIFELLKAGGFALILKYQLYPWTHRELAKRVKEELGLPGFGRGNNEPFLEVASKKHVNSQVDSHGVWGKSFSVNNQNVPL